MNKTKTVIAVIDNVGDDRRDRRRIPFASVRRLLLCATRIVLKRVGRKKKKINNLPITPHILLTLKPSSSASYNTAFINNNNSNYSDGVNGADRQARRFINLTRRIADANDIGAVNRDDVGLHAAEGLYCYDVRENVITRGPVCSGHGAWEWRRMAGASGQNGRRGGACESRSRAALGTPVISCS